MKILNFSNSYRLKYGFTILLTLFWAGLAPGISYADTYYVDQAGNDANPGTEALPWETIGKAADKLKAGDTVYIKAGVYQEKVTPLNSGSPGSYITYSAYPGHTVTIDGTGIILAPIWPAGLFTVEERRYIKVSGLRVINAGPNPNSAGIYVDTSDHIIIEKNYTENTVSSGIGVWDGNNIIIDGNEVRLACNDGEQEDITVSGTDTFEVRNNHIHEGGPGTNGGEGITIKGGATNGKVYKNHVHDLTRGERTCIYIDGWGETKATSNIEVYQNIVHNCAAGITLASEDGSLVGDIRIYNNIAYSNQTNGLEIGNWGEPGIAKRPVENITFINNTVYGNGTSGWGGGFANENPDVKNLIVSNNIFSQNPSFQILDDAKLPATEITIDYNLIHDFIDEEANEIVGSNHVAGDPIFVDPVAADFHLQAISPAIDAGTPTNAPGDDFEGNPRPNGVAFDIGAYEYGPIPLNLYLQNESLSWIKTYNATNSIYAGSNVTNTKDPGDFTIESGAVVKMKAGNSIHLAPGFIARKGCEFGATVK